MFHFRGADAKAQRPEGSIGCGMAIAACDQHAWRDQAPVRDNDMFNALARVAKP